MTLRAAQFGAPSSWPFFVLALIFVLMGKGCGDIAHAQSPPDPVTIEPHLGAPMAVPAEFMLPDTRVELRRQALAPFDGILFDAPTLVRWVQRIDWLSRRLHLEHDLHVQLEEASRHSYEDLTAQLTASYEREIAEDRRIIDEAQASLERAQRRIAQLERRPPHRAFAIGTGLGAGLVLAAGVVGAVLAH